MCELFFPAAERGAVFEEQVAAAKRVCAGCPVQPACLDYALAVLSDGIAGGMTPQERAAVRRAGEGSPAATGAPLRIFAARNALAGNRALEGHEGR